MVSSVTRARVQNRNDAQNDVKVDQNYLVAKTGFWPRIDFLFLDFEKRSKNRKPITGKKRKKLCLFSEIFFPKYFCLILRPFNVVFAVFLLLNINIEKSFTQNYWSKRTLIFPKLPKRNKLKLWIRQDYFLLFRKLFFRQCANSSCS